MRWRYPSPNQRLDAALLYLIAYDEPSKNDVRIKRTYYRGCFLDSQPLFESDTVQI